MSNTIGFGQAAVNNTIDYGQGAIDNTINWGKSQTLSPSGETNITGTPSTPPFSNVNSFSFDGVDDYFLGVGTYSELDGQSKMTFSAWIKADSLSSTSYLFGIGGSTTLWQVAVRLQSLSTTDARCYFYINGGTNNQRSYANLGAIKNDGQWHHLMICMDLVNFSSFDEVDYFLDGNLLTTNGYYNPTSLVNAGTPLNIGNRENPNTGLMVGAVDEFAIWSGTDLRNDVATIYNNGTPTDLNNNGLTAPTTWQRMGDNATWNGATWTMTDVNGGYTNRSINMVEANRTTDVPPNPFANTKSILLDGVDDKVTFSDITASDEFTISFWVKPTVFLSNGGSFVFGTETGNANFFRLKDASSAQINIGGSLGGYNNGGSGDDFVLNQWQNVMIVRNSNSDVVVYVNGVAWTNGVNNSNTLTINSIGRIISSSFGYSGHIDEFAFWDSDQSANASDIGGTIPTDLSSYSPLHWYRCGDGDTSPTLTDNGSGGNDGTMTNFTTFSTDVPT